MSQFRAIVVHTLQLHALTTFYTQLGFRFECLQAYNGIMYYASKSLPKLEIRPLHKSGQSNGNTVTLEFGIKDLDQVVKQLTSRGISIVQHPTSTPLGYSAIVLDPDGRRVTLVQV
ncbi:hypothetical protein COR50_16775 [Chitinophaga caeni]|uniref:VOC domain-containing protein n=1 Tax=Chitinophaga caeni TaxID=2029983 RepID=A0A291QXS6_9BACT|nr:VOC family protein [Chitinophaga caeni]ATL48682.1 hypothetical protein COR50_16775 [Chitinophaga caeni]